MAAPSVPSRQARGTFRFGSSTASEFCAADSRPRKAQSVTAMLEFMPCNGLRPLGFQAALKVWPLNQNQPMSERPATGMITPQMATAPIRPVTAGLPKFATVVSQIRAITPKQVAVGVDVSQGRSVARYPSAEIAIATF